jgi:hypothetical protein
MEWNVSGHPEDLNGTDFYTVLVSLTLSEDVRLKVFEHGVLMEIFSD